MRLNRNWCVFALSAAVAIVPAMARPNVAEKAMNNANAETRTIDDTAQKLYLEAPDGELSWQGQSVRLEQLKDSVNQVADQVAHLNLWQNMETRQEQKAVRESQPLLKDMATQTSAAIRFLNENAHGLFEPEYRDHLKKIANDAEQMHRLFQESTKLHSLNIEAAQLRHKLNRS